MNLRNRRVVLTASALLLAAGLLATRSQAQILFSDDFDDGNAASRYSAPFFSTEVVPTPGPGEYDGVVNFALDYSTLPGYMPLSGDPAIPVPPVPSSTGGTIGLGIQVNNFDEPGDEGEAIGVSPLIAGLPSDYTITVDAFIYYESGGGSSEHAVLGVNGDGTAVPFTFVPSGAGQYYHVPHNSGLDNTAYADDYYRVTDGTVTKLYDGDDGTAVRDPETIGIFPDGTDPVFNDAGFPGNQWMALRLTKEGDTIKFYVSDTLLDTFDASSGATSGDIVLAAADIFNSANSTNWIIFDNLVVEAGVIPPPMTDNADFDGDTIVDGGDFLAWQRGFPVTDGTALLGDGDANGDGNVAADDLTIWQSQFGASAGSITSVPEPASQAVMLVLATIMGLACRKSRS